MNPRSICGYEIIRQLAQGGMGIVYLGRNADTDDLVAIKALQRSNLGQEDEWLARFLQEGKALQDLDHPNIVKLVTTCAEADRHYIVMEYLDGGSLAERLAESDEPLPLVDLLDISLQLADALTRAHYLKIIHRDLKPANVLMSADGHACLSDFGVARMGPSQLTTDGAIVGTMSYLSPEVVQGQDASEKSDIWSFGVMLFEMLAGSHPFQAESPGAMLHKILAESPPDLESIRPDIPHSLVDLVYRMLHKDPGQRISSIRQVGASLEAIGNAEIVEFTTWRSTSGTFAMQATDNTRPTTSKLPAHITPFLGRSKELAALTKLLLGEETRLVTLLGPGGIGKTRLAVETARCVAERFKDGVAFVPLASLDSIDSLIPAIWEAVEYPPVHADIRTPEEQTADYFARKEMLLVFDNCEHLLEGAELIYGLLRSASGVRVLATTTERLNLQGETIFRLEGIEYPHGQSGETALDSPAVRLFIDTSRRWRPGFEVNDENLPYIVRVCQLVQGLPLGILLAAAWVDALSVKEIADEIAGDLDFLSTEMRDVPVRQRSIRATFDGAWRRLSATEQEVFARLAVFRGGFDLEAARAIAGASVRNLLSLSSKSLLWRDANSGRYNIHRLLRQFAEEELVRRGELEKVQRQHAEYFAGLAEHIDRQLREPNELPWYGRLREENDNFLSALDWALIQEKDPVVGGRLFAGLGFEWFLTDNVVDGTNWMERSLKFVDALPDEVQARVYNRSGLIGCVQGNYAQAAAHHAKSAQLFRRIGDQGFLAYSLLAQANMSYEAGMKKPAFPLVEESLMSAYRAEDPFFLSASLSGAIWYARRAGDTERARGLLLEKIRLAESFPNHNIRYGTFRSQAFMARHEGNLELAIEKFQQAMAIAQDLRWTPNELDMMEELAYTHYLAGDPDLAMSIFSDALQQSRRIGHFNLLVWKMIGLAMITLQAGKNEQAQVMFKERLLCQPDDTVTWQIALSLAGLGKLAWLKGDKQEAAVLLGASEAMVESGDLLPFAWFTDEWRQIMSDLKPQLDGLSWDTGRALSGPQAVEYALRQSTTSLRST